MPTTNCLYTRVRNVSGGPLVLSFIPPRGVSLADGAEVSVFGDLRSALTAMGGKGRRAQASLESLLLGGKITIVDTPAPIVLDTGISSSYALGSSAGAPSYGTPCWI